MSRAALIKQVATGLHAFDATVRANMGSSGAAAKELRKHLFVTQKGFALSSGNNDGDDAASKADDAAVVEQQRALIRASLISMPATVCANLPEDVVAAQEALLAEELAAAGPEVVNAQDLRRVSPKYPVAVWRGDMSKLVCDAVVNPANGVLLGCFLPSHKCLDNILHAQAGPRLRVACMQQKAQENINTTPNGCCMVTSAFALPSKMVYHTVGPCLLDECKSQRDPPRAPTEVDKAELMSCYTSCLEQGKRDGITSIAFCCISTGIFAYPSDEAATLACHTVKQWMCKEMAEGKALEELPTVVFNVFAEKDLDLYQQIAPNVFV